MEYWQEFRTAYHLAKLGTVTAAAEATHVHRATVIRHVDTLEDVLATKLFLRHNRGYELTEIGEQFLQVGRDVDSLIEGFFGRVRGQQEIVRGRLVISTIPAFMPLLIEPINQYRAVHTTSNIEFAAAHDLPALEYGKVHIALWHGHKPEHDDYVVQPLESMNFGLYAHDTYVARKGLPSSPDAFLDHDFVGNPEYPTVFEKWLQNHVPKDRFFLTSAAPEITHSVVIQGLAIGFLPQSLAQKTKGIHEIVAPKPDWSAPMWLVTHVDLHRTPKIQAMLHFLKEHKI
ncbi:MAG: LysR family transcriptional regulator [Pseudomonadota bacterium]